MAYADWKIHGDDTLAAYLPEKTFKGILEKRVGIPPDLVGILIKDGQLTDTYHGAHFSVGGIWQRIKESFGGKHSLRLLVADLKPFPLRAGLKGNTKDNVDIQGEIAFELQLDPETPVNILGLVENDRSLTRADVYRRIRPHLQERVFLHELVQHDAADLRANRGLQDRMQADAMREVERVVGRLGLMVNAVSINWARNAEEAQAIKIADAEREERRAESEFARAKRELERDTESTVFQLQSDLEIERVKASSETELEALLLEGQLAVADARDTGARLAERKALTHELEVVKERRLARYEEVLGDAQTEFERDKIGLERRKLELEFEKLKGTQDAEMQRLTNEVQRDKLKGLQDLDEESAQAAHGRDKDKFETEHGAAIKEKEADSQAELEKLRAQGAMTPDQILAIQAGLSPDVARAFSEKAKAGADREGLLREMLELSKSMKADSDAQTAAMVDKAMDRLADMGMAAAAAGAGNNPTGARGSTASGGSGAPVAVECPKCRHEVPGRDRFCRSCGHKLRS